MSRRQPTRKEMRTVACPACQASPGHPCVEIRTTGQHGKHLGRTQDRCHQARLEAFHVKQV